MKLKLQYEKLLKRDILLSSKTIENYIESIPPIPAIVKECSDALAAGDMVNAADIASRDRALTHYLQNIVNKPIFGFRNEVKDIRQVFGILGIAKAKQLIYGYYLLLILPKKWKVFDFDSTKFQDFQARLIHHWGRIISSFKETDSEIIPAISIIPASLVVIEMLFCDIDDSVKLLRETKQMSYEAILERMTNKTVFDISSMIAKKWDFSEEIIELIGSIGDPNFHDGGVNDLEMAYLRMLLFYEMSRPVMIQSGLNDLFEFKFDFDDEVSNNFYNIMYDSQS